MLTCGSLAEECSNFDRDSVTAETLAELRKLTRFGLFRPNYMRCVSAALAGLGFWALSIDQYCTMKGMV